MKVLKNPFLLDVVAATVIAGAAFFTILFFTSNSGGIALLPEAQAYPKEVVLDPSTLTAQSAVVYNPQTGEVLYAKEADVQRPLASLTKLMAAAAVLSTHRASTTVAITADDLKPSGDWDLRVGEEWLLDDLVTFGLVASSNDAMAAAAASLQGSAVDNMNKAAKNLGLSQTYFLNTTGLDEDLETAGAYGSARDMALLTAKFLQEFPTFFEATAQSGVTIKNFDHTLYAESTAAPLLDIPGLIGAKTGYTDLAGGNLVAAIDIEIGHPIIIAVLGSTREGRFEDVKKLLEAVRSATLPPQ